MVHGTHGNSVITQGKNRCKQTMLQRGFLALMLGFSRKVQAHGNPMLAEDGESWQDTYWTFFLKNLPDLCVCVFSLWCGMPVLFYHFNYQSEIIF